MAGAMAPDNANKDNGWKGGGGTEDTLTNINNPGDANGDVVDDKEFRKSKPKRTQEAKYKNDRRFRV